MSEIHEFRAVIRQAEGGGAFVEVPFDVEKAFGKKRVQVEASIDGEPYRGSLVRMGGDRHMLIVLKEIRERIGKGGGDEVEVRVREDVAPRVVRVPPDLESALEAEPAARAFWETLAYTPRREFVRSIEEAKRAETRRARVERTIVMLKQGKRPR